MVVHIDINGVATCSCFRVFSSIKLLYLFLDVRAGLCWRACGLFLPSIRLCLLMMSSSEWSSSSARYALVPCIGASLVDAVYGESA